MADNKCLTQRTYNITGMSFSPEEVAAEIKKEIPDFEIEYSPDFRQQIAATWPRTIDDSKATEDWGWKPEFDLHNMSLHMLSTLRSNLKRQELKARSWFLSNYNLLFPNSKKKK